MCGRVGYCVCGSRVLCVCVEGCRVLYVLGEGRVLCVY